MATRSQDQELVAGVAQKYGLRTADARNLGEQNNVHGQTVPCFGWHPWFSHQIYDDTGDGSGQTSTTPDKISHYQAVLTPKPDDHKFMLALPNPRLLSTYLAHTKDYLKQYPLALIGEVGLDRSFRIPNDWVLEQQNERDASLTPGGREGRRLSPYRVKMDHQCRILKAQLHLAGEMQRAVSLHGVQAHGVLFETVQETWRGHEVKVVGNRARHREGRSVDAHSSQDQHGKLGGTDLASRPFPPRICLHSYSGPPDTLRQYLHPSIPTKVYFSFSIVINFSTPFSNKVVQVIRAVPKDRLLVESDLHCAGERMEHLLEEVTRSICDIRGWSLSEGVKQLASNWKQFMFGDQQYDSASTQH
ncbi:hypothetical protein MMC16_007736 [Acarospora aff. strigata]|nr:hypothetical protein [Acarospora aff. strigata]